MKLCRNELLLMGGMYQILAFVFALFNTELSVAMIGVLYVLFWVAVLTMSMALIPSWGFVHKMNDMFPKISVFLASIGWIPYFAVFYALLTYTVDFFVNGSDSVTAYLNNFMPVFDVYMAAIVLSLLYATYRVFKGENLEMSCWAPM